MEDNLNNPKTHFLMLQFLQQNMLDAITIATIRKCSEDGVKYEVLCTLESKMQHPLYAKVEINTEAFKAFCLQKTAIKVIEIKSNPWSVL